MEKYYNNQPDRSLFDIKGVQVIDSLPDAAFAIDRRGCVVAWNPMISNMTGVAAKDIVCKNNLEYSVAFYGEKRPILIDLVIKPDKDIEDTYPHFSRDKFGVTGENEFQSHGNQKKHLCGRASPILDPGGCIIGAIEIIRDYTSVRETEKYLKENELRFRIMSEKSPIGIYMYDHHDKSFLYANPALASILECESDTFIVTDEIECRIHPDDLPKIREFMETGTPEETPSAHHVIRIITRNGDIKYLETAIRPVLYKGIKVSIGTCQNITERINIQNGLTTNEEHLEKIIEENTHTIHMLEDQKKKIEMYAYSGQIAAHIAHEINNPLAGIKNSMLLIKEAVPPDHPNHHYVELVENEINRLSTITKQMFGLYNPGHISKKEFNLKDLINDIVALLESSRREHNVNIIVSAEAICIDHIPESLLRQTLYNIIINAIDASEMGKDIIINAGADPSGGITISVTDHGQGIPDDVKPYVFTPFFSTKKGDQNGLGLGLAITKKIIDELCGTLSFVTTPGHGTTFTIFLPIIKNQDEWGCTCHGTQGKHLID